MFDTFKPNTNAWTLAIGIPSTELFKRVLAETGQVCIMIRTVSQDTDVPWRTYNDTRR